MKSLDDLVKELEDNRKGNYDILAKIQGFRDKLDILLPTGTDYRDRFKLENKMKTFTEIIKAELDVRKTIDSSIKSEFDLKKKMEDSERKEDETFSYNDLQQIVKIATKK